MRGPGLDAARCEAAYEAARRIGRAADPAHALELARGALASLLEAEVAVAAAVTERVAEARAQGPAVLHAAIDSQRHPASLRAERERPFALLDQHIAHFIAQVTAAACDRGPDGDLLAEIQIATQLASMGALAARTAHQLNNPAGVILGYAQVLREHHGDAAARNQALNAIERQAERFAEIGRTLGRFAQASCPDYGWAHLDEIAATAVARVAPIATRHQVSLRADPIEPRLQLRAHAADLVTTLALLLERAVAAAAPAGTVLLSIAAEKRLERDGVGISVRCQRAGDAPETDALSHLRERVAERLGLPLALVRPLVELYAGDLDLIPDGDGAALRAWFPC
ncbi:MAG: HAMP domain-containing histidine kinase [Deltaproteobacteria bacterium]|nr:HAMP domain-containing histidine kinase [Deltaproteobacteria bacterium]